MKQLLQVIALPTDKESVLSIRNDIESDKFYLDYQSIPFIQTELTKPYHIYWISNSEIKEGDNICNTFSGEIEKSDGTPILLGFSNYRKIEACSNPSLNLPLIDNNFIQEFVKAQGGIKEVEVEMKYNNIINQMKGDPYGWQIKTNSNNEAIWSLKEDNDFEKYREMFDKSFAKVTANDFIKEMESLGYKFIEENL